MSNTNTGMDKQYEELNEFLDKCINEALQETTGKFQVPVDHRGFNHEQYAQSERFRGFKEDKIDPESEKMKDYERPPPYKIYQRPLTAEETKSYRKYEEDMGRLKPGQKRPGWDGLDESINFVDRTEEYSKPWDKSTAEQRNKTQPQQAYQRPEQKQETRKEGYYSSAKPKSSHSQEKWTYDKTDDEETDTDTRRNVSRPKPKPDMFDSTSDQEVDPRMERWAYKPKFSNVDNSKSTYRNNLETDAQRRFSDSGLPRRQGFASSKNIQSGAPFKTHKNVSEIESEYNKENWKPKTTSEAQEDTKEENKEEMLPGMNSEKVKQELLKLRPAIQERSVWGALPPMGKVTPMKPPADTIVFTLSTGTPECSSEEECRRTVREIQARHMGRGLADIQYNFLVGGDGNLYEGRGWGVESGIKEEKKQGKNYNIAFIGDFQGNIDTIPPHMLGPVQDLIVWGNAIRLMTPETKSAGEYRVPQKEEV